MSSNVVVEPHMIEGTFFIRDKDEVNLCTKSMSIGPACRKTEKVFSVENRDGTRDEYMVWEHRLSKLATAILSGISDIWIKPDSRVLYLGAGSGSTIYHVSNLVGPTGVVYAVESAHSKYHGLYNISKQRRNVIPIFEDARHPHKYRMVIVGMVDVIISDIAHLDQAEILSWNASRFLKHGGHFVLSIKDDSKDATNLHGITASRRKGVFFQKVKNLLIYEFKPIDRVLLEPYYDNFTCIIGLYKNKKIDVETIINRDTLALQDMLLDISCENIQFLYHEILSLVPFINSIDKYSLQLVRFVSATTYDVGSQIEFPVIFRGTWMVEGGSPEGNYTVISSYHQEKHQLKVFADSDKVSLPCTRPYRPGTSYEDVNIFYYNRQEFY